MSDMKDKTGPYADGGQAFPQTIQRWNETFEPRNGMSLRDYFAAKAMQSALVGATAGGEEQVPELMALVSTIAYMAADAMLAAREVKE